MTVFDRRSKPSPRQCRRFRERAHRLTHFYAPFGPVASITYGTGGNARTLNRTYDQDYVIGSVKDPGTDGLDLNYSRDALGNLTQIANTAGTSGNNYAYDALNRLTSVKDLGNNALDAYTYDGTGNRTSKTVGGVTQTYTYYPNTTHRLFDVSGTGRTYDVAGNTKSIGSNAMSFTYNDLGRMDAVKFNNVLSKAYAYDARGERVRKVHSGYTSETLKTIFDESGHILGDFDGANNIIDEVIWMDDLPVGVLNGSSQVVNYIEPDHLGTPRTVIDPTRNLAVWKWNILNDPFGEFSPNGDPDGDSIVYTLNLRFPGQEWDAESGLSYNFFRDYDSNTGRYVESDPIGLGGGVSTYGYSNLSPLSFSDPSGQLANPAEGTCVDPLQPVCIGGVVVDVGSSIILGNAASSALSSGGPPPGMTRTQQSIYTAICKNGDDRCTAIKAYVQQLINKARSLMDEMFRDKWTLYHNARDARNPDLGTSTTWKDHGINLWRVIAKIWEAIGLGEMIPCDMSQERIEASHLFVPQAPNPPGSRL